MNTLDMFAQMDKDIEEWRLKIRNIDMCRVVQCYNRPAIKCKKRVQIIIVTSYTVDKSS
jgi:hypothetical protein